MFQSEVQLLRSKGHDVIEYLEFNSRIKSMSKVSVGLQTFWSQSSYSKVKEVILKTKPQVAHFHNTFPLISPSAYYACQEINIPVVQTLDNQRLICPASTFYRDGKLCLDCLGRTPPLPSIVHRCYHDSYVHTAIVASMITAHRWMKTWQTKVNAFLCSTNFYKDLFIQSGFPQNKLFVMPHFVDINKQIRISKEQKDYAVFIGRLDAEKGVQTLLSAWRNLKIPLKIRGTGRLEDSLRKYVKQHQMNHVEFMDQLDSNEIYELIHNAAFLVMPSEGYYETFGMVIIEAYSQSTPVLASNIGVVPEIVSNNKTGILFQSGDSYDLAQKAEWMWSHKKEIEIMGRNGFDEYKKKYTSEICYETLINTYNKIVDGK